VTPERRKGLLRERAWIDYYLAGNGWKCPSCASERQTHLGSMLCGGCGYTIFSLEHDNDPPEVPK